MIGELRRLAQRIRHLPLLEGWEPLWRMLRGPYQRLLRTSRSGVPVVVGGKLEVRIPAEYAGASWESYEREAIGAFVEWIARNPACLVLDVGSATGIFSTVALSSSKHAEVVAFEPDLESLAACQRMTEYSGRERLRMVHGFLASRSSGGASLEQAVRKTAAELEVSAARGSVGSTRYRALSDAAGSVEALYRLDELLPGDDEPACACILKCDVEGSELRVLSGGAEFLRRRRPALLLSVHPEALRTYGDTRESLLAFLGGLGYKTRTLAIDHEEHWWCEVPGEKGP